MSIVLSYSTETVRGPVILTADLTGMKSYQVSDEISHFFSALLSLRSAVRREEEESQRFRESLNASFSPAPDYPQVDQEPVTVAS